MSYADYAKKEIKRRKRKKLQIKNIILLGYLMEKNLCLKKELLLKKKAIDLAINYATDMVKYNGYKEFKFDLEENIDNWTDEQIDMKSGIGFLLELKNMVIK